MRKNLSYIAILSLLLLSACSSGNDGNASVDDSSADHDDTLTEENNGADADESAETEDPEEEAADEPDEEIAEEPAAPRYRIDPATYSIIPIDDADPEVVLITIDDAPDKRAMDMAETLKEMDVPAIFFVNGHFLSSDEKKETLRKIHEMGFVIGNHTKTHANLKTLTEEEQREEILSVNELVEEITGEKPVFFRAPFGANTDYSRDLTAQEGMQLMNWSYGYDFEKAYMTKEAIADIMVNTELLRNGANLLMHDREWTADALEEIITGLRDKGYGFVDPHEIEGMNAQ